jgi:hypothetical protein
MKINVVLGTGQLEGGDGAFVDTKMNRPVPLKSQNFFTSKLPLVSQEGLCVTKVALFIVLHLFHR